MATNVATLSDLRQPPAPQQHAVVRAGFFDAAGFELMQRVSKAFAASTLVPAQYQGNLANCMIAINMAQRIGADPMMVMQNLYIVHGRPGWSAQFLIATFNHCGRFSALRYEWFGDRGKDSWGCRAYATEKDTGEKIVGPDITIALAKSEGWESKSGSKWKTIPQLMLMYRAAAWLIRTYAPEIAMGLQTAEEIGDTFDASREDDGSFGVTLDTLRQEHAAIDVAPAAEASPAEAETPKRDVSIADMFTFAEIAARLNKATTEDQRIEAAGLISGLKDARQRTDLEALSMERRDAIAAGGK